MPDDALKVDLSTVDSDDLWHELRSRFSDCMLVFSRDGKNVGEVYNDIYWYGSKSQVLGLAEYAKLRITAIIMATEKREADDDD